MKDKKNTILIIAIILVIALIIALVVIKKNYNKVPNNPNNQNTETLADKEKEFSQIEEELVKIESSQEEERSNIEKLNEDLASFVKANPNLEESAVRESEEYKKITNQIRQLEDNIRAEDETKLSYQERQAKLQEEINKMKSAQ